MRLLFDQNLSHRLVGRLTSLYPGSEHVRSLGLAAADDEAIWDYAARNGLAIVSKDSDFQQRSLLRGHPPKVVQIRLGNCPTAVIEALLTQRLADLLAFDADPLASILVLS
jgi:predicted nuclease of predicted toxin-antitoxin system